jgi:hypothetical protein
MIRTLRRFSHFATASLLLVPVVLAFEAAADHHEKSTAWDQAKVTDLASQLATSANEIYRSVSRMQTGSELGSGQANSYLRLKDNLRVARNESKHLAKALGDGKGRDETLHTYKRLMTLVRDARETGRSMFIEQPTLDKIGVANGLLDQLDPFYSE